MVVCLNCKKKIEDKWLKYHPNRIHKFCSRKCIGLFYFGKFRLKDNKKRIYICAYCGNKVERWMGDVKYKKVYCSRKCSAQGNKKFGLLSPNWKGGITPKINVRCNSDWWIKLRKQIYKRDNYCCQLCKKTNCKLECHHIKPENVGGLHTPNNLISLCTSCHKLIEWKMNRYTIFKTISREESW